MINISLKSKHFYLIAADLKNNAAFYSQTTNNAIASATNGTLDDDTVAIDIDVAMFVSVFQTLSLKPEGQYNRINSEMMDLLAPQLAAGVQSGNEEWISAATQINAIRDANWAVADDMIAQGKAFIDSING